jgi:hypothetical protein
LRETAIEWLMLVREHGGDPMVPRIAMLKSAATSRAEAAPAPRRKRAKANEPRRNKSPLMVLDLCSAAFVGVE